jgi:hypothetical protein
MTEQMRQEYPVSAICEVHRAAIILSGTGNRVSGSGSRHSLATCLLLPMRGSSIKTARCMKSLVSTIDNRGQ